MRNIIQHDFLAGQNRAQIFSENTEIEDRGEKKEVIGEVTTAPI